MHIEQIIRAFAPSPILASLSQSVHLSCLSSQRGLAGALDSNLAYQMHLPHQPGREIKLRSSAYFA